MSQGLTRHCPVLIYPGQDCCYAIAQAVEYVLRGGEGYQGLFIPFPRLVRLSNHYLNLRLCCCEQDSKIPLFVKYGTNHIVAKRATLAVIGQDVDPIELFVCKMGVPYIIVKGKVPLGNVVRKKTTAVVALQEVKREVQRELATLVSAAKANL